MTEPAQNFEPYLATTAAMLIAEGMIEAAELLRTSSARVEATGHDNWNGGTTLWTVYLSIGAAEYARLGDRHEQLEEQINKRLGAVVGKDSQDWYAASIVPRLEKDSDWREASGEVSQVVRRNIVDGLRIDNVAWAGRLDEVEFLERIYDLQTLPSQDSRFKNAAGDIWQHRVNNPLDWPDDWIYADGRFGLLTGPSTTFMRFLCEMVHPVVRPDRNEALQLVQHFNDQLRRAGWNLVEEEKIAGRPRFVAKPLGLSGARLVSRAKTVADALNAGWMQKEIERLENAIDRDPALAIGTAKELVETCCKSILTKRNIAFSPGADLPDLTKSVLKELSLVPEGISDEARGAETVRLILRNLSVLTKYLAELRGLYGSGHGRDGQHRGLEPRHARLAVASAVAFIDFVTETYHRRESTRVAEAGADAGMTA